ncbi:MAG: Rrf2 family transcriptional regulator [Clostridia bacterium]|nr:Rrf2 family transcriptional regulator [Clostridia bacterium]
MRITNQFTIAVHLLVAVKYFEGREVTSGFLAGSVGTNPVIVRTVMSDLKRAGLLTSSQGKTGITLSRPLEEITFFDVYAAVDSGAEGELFHFHEPNPLCPVGRNVHAALDDRLTQVRLAMEGEMKKIYLSDVYEDVKRAIEKQS